MISRIAVQELLDRNGKSIDWIKKLSNEQLDQELKKRNAAPWTSEPMHHQKVGVLAGLIYPCFFMLFDPGLGKTYTALQILRSRKANNQVKRALVLVPGVTNIGAWEDEVKTHAPELTVKGFYKMSKSDKERAVRDNYDIIVMTYMGWLSLLGARKKKGKKRDINDANMESIERLFDMVIWDESDQLKSAQSTSTKLAARLTKTAKYRICLSGTPFDKNPMDLWSQFYILDKGSTLGETLALFQATFCKQKYNPFTGGIEFDFNKKFTNIISEKVKQLALIYYEKDCLDLPETIGGLLSKNYMVRPVPFLEENLRQYQAVVYELKSAGDKSVIKNIYTRLRQATAGYLTIKDGDTKSYVFFDKSPKLDALLEVIEKEIPADDKIIVFTEYVVSGELVCNMLDKHGYKYVRVYSQTKDKNEAIRKFKEDPKTRILVGSRSVCYGLNIQGANRLIMFESPDSTIKRQQLERRIRRARQTKVTYIYDLVVQNSVDTKILDSLRSGKNLIDEILASKDPLSLL